MPLLLPGAGLASDLRHHLTNHLGAFGDAFAGRTYRRLTQQGSSRLKGLREPRLERLVHRGGCRSVHRPREGRGDDKTHGFGPPLRGAFRGPRKTISPEVSWAARAAVTQFGRVRD